MRLKKATFEALEEGVIDELHVKSSHVARTINAIAKIAHPDQKQRGARKTTIELANDLMMKSFLHLNLRALCNLYKTELSGSARLSINTHK